MVSNEKLTRGKQKIEMKLIDHDEDRMTTFSKRRSGIYKKASELVTMCDANVGIVIFSPTGKPFSFGHPDIESITSRFMNNDVVGPVTDQVLLEMVRAHKRAEMDRQNDQLNKIAEQLNEAKEKGKTLRKTIREMMKNNPGHGGEPGWWEQSPDNLIAPPEIENAAASVAAFHHDLCRHMNYPVDLMTGLRLANPEAVNDPMGEAEARAGPSGENSRN